MEFEFDPLKSEINREKHGITLADAASLWNETGVEIEARTTDERRFLRIGKLGQKCYSCVFTLREGKVRLISARRSRPDEEKIYREIIDEKAKEKKNESG